ncbi:MAG TPA: MerR family transcriptional regulator [Dehalococcoidales bacterium]|nr:MAG: MerR family transcriptional regulator [Chloroflexi bacterium RBG_16_60_22]HJX12098.1 MerR family transcriptional regulator [Dehalococcoidales bacterium]
MSKERYDSEPRYVISVAARMLDMQTYTLRYYEKVGIIEPRRSRGNVRLYSDRDIALLQRVKSLVEDMGINLPGVEVILRMMEHVGQLQSELEQALEELKQLKRG